jgi:flagellar hook-associated protein 1 FlgK
MSDLLRIGSHSLLAYQAALNVVGQNIANVTTPFYSRREVNFSEAIFNNGVNVADVKRVFSETASQNLQTATSDLAGSESYLHALKDLESLFGDAVESDPSKADSNSIGRYITEMINSLNQLNTSPQSLQARNLYLAQLSNLATRFNQISGQIQLQGNNVNALLLSDANSINQVTTQLAQINAQIQAETTKDHNALMDQREILLQKLATFGDFTRINLDNGEVNITLKDGTPVIFGNVNYTFSTTMDPQNPSNQRVVLEIGNNNVVVNDLFSAGEVSGLNNFRANLAQADRSLGRIALAIASVVNSQNKLGMDIHGNLGANLFNDINDASLVAARAIPATTNTGTTSVSVNILNTNQLVPSDYSLSFTAENQYSLTRLCDNTVVSSGSLSTYPATISVDGFSFSINSASFAVGDIFTISPTRSASISMNVIVSDPSMVALAYPIATSPNSSNLGTGKIETNAITNTASSAFSVPLQLNPPLQIQFINSTSYQIINSTTSAVIEGPLTYNATTGIALFPTPGGYDPGYRVTISGEVQAGDSFLVQYNTNSSGDNRNGRYLANLLNQGMLDNGNSTCIQAYNALSSDIAVSAYAANLSYQSADILKTQAQDYYDSISGVSLEEETVNLAQYQQAYQASAQILEAARTIFDAILKLSRGV